MLSISQLAITAPGSPRALVIPSRRVERVALSCMMDISLAPVKKKLTYAISNMSAKKSNKMPTMSWHCWLCMKVRSDCQKSLCCALRAVLGLLPSVVGRVGLAVRAAINLHLIHSYCLGIVLFRFGLQRYNK